MHDPRNWRDGPYNYLDLTYCQGSYNQHVDALYHMPVTMVTISSDLDSTAMAAALKSDPCSAGHSFSTADI